MLERFDEAAVLAVLLASDASRKTGHNFAGTEQLLLGIAGVPGIASETLASFGVYGRNLRPAVLNITGRGTYHVDREIPFTPRAQRVLQLASEQSQKLGSNKIGTEHLLLGLLIENAGVAISALEDLGVDSAEVRTVLFEVMNGMPVPDPIEAAVLISEECVDEFAGALSLEEAVGNLCATYAFIKRSSVSESMLDWVDQKESIIGVYINAQDNYLVICKEGIHYYDGEAKAYIGFNTTVSVELPNTEDDRYLRLILRPGKQVFMLPVWHATEDVLDLFHMYDFIRLTLKTPAAKRDIRTISSKDDLIDYLRQPSVTTEGLTDLAAWLEDGSPRSSWLETLKIDPTVWQDPNALRLMALIFTRFPNCAERN